MGSTRDDMSALGKTITSAMMLKSQLNALKRTLDMSIEAYLSQFKEIKDALSSIGHGVTDQELTRIIMQGLDSSFDTFVMTVSLKNKFPSFSKFCELLLLETQRRELSSGPSSSKTDQALITQAKKKKGKGQDKSDSNKDNQKTADNKGKPSCGYCNRKGHSEAKCYKKAFDDREANLEPQSNAVEAS